MVNYSRFISFIFILTLSFHSWTKADDIRDFEIEGMSVGDSLLEYMSVEEINDNTFTNYYKNGKKRNYYATGYFNTDTYDQIEIYLKKGDQNYNIVSITGFKVELKNCKKLKKKIVNQISEIFNSLEPISYDDVPHTFDKSGKSIQHQTGFFFENDPKKDHIRIECTYWSKEMKEKNQFNDTIGISVITTELLKWIDSGYN